MMSMIGELGPVFGVAILQPKYQGKMMRTQSVLTGMVLSSDSETE